MGRDRDSDLLPWYIGLTINSMSSSSHIHGLDNGDDKEKMSIGICIAREPLIITRVSGGVNTSGSKEIIVASSRGMFNTSTSEHNHDRHHNSE